MVAYYRKRPPMTKATAKTTIAKAIAKRRTNLAVKKTYFRKPINKNSNYNAINTLSKQVRMLQMARYGFKQFQHQHMSYVSDPTLTTLSLAQVSPLGFMLQNFYDGAGIWYGLKTGVAPNQIASYAQTAKWNVVRNDNGLAPQYNWNQKQEEDNLSTVAFLPLSTTLKFRFRCISSGPSQTPIRVRVTILKLKTSADRTDLLSSLPSTLGAYANLVDRNPETRQYLNTHKFHTIVKEYNILFPQTDVVKTDIERQITYKHIFDGKTAVEFDKTSEPNLDMRHNIPMHEQIWCILSTDNANTDGSRLNVQMERWNTWRDQHGIGS